MITQQWGFPAHDDVVMNLLEDTFDTELVWVGSWEPDQDTADEYLATVIVTDNGYNTIAEKRADAKRLAAEVATVLNALPGRDVRGVLVDDVVENTGPRMVGDIDHTKRTYGMVYTLAFRKQLVEGD